MFHYFKIPYLHVIFLQNLLTMDILDHVSYRTLFYDFRPVISPRLLIWPPLSPVVFPSRSTPEGGGFTKVDYLRLSYWCGPLHACLLNIVVKAGSPLPRRLPYMCFGEDILRFHMKLNNRPKSPMFAPH
jgi:hypothetical protein